MRKEILKTCSCCNKKKPGVKIHKIEDFMTGEIYEGLMCPKCYDNICAEL